MKNRFSEYFSFTSLNVSSECQMNDGNAILAHGVALKQLAISKRQSILTYPKLSEFHKKSLKTYRNVIKR